MKFLSILITDQFKYADFINIKPFINQFDLKNDHLLLSKFYYRFLYFKDIINDIHFLNQNEVYLPNDIIEIIFEALASYNITFNYEQLSILSYLVYNNLNQIVLPPHIKSLILETIDNLDFYQQSELIKDLKQFIKNALKSDAKNSFNNSEYLQLEYGKKISFNEKYNYDSICTICQSDFKENDDIIQLNCHHVFHKSCMNQHLNYKYECPMCRDPILIL